MKNKIIYLFTFLIPIFLISCTDSASDKPPPQITAQGFIVDEVQEGTIGQFKNVKLRIESTGRIKKLYISERSYEVDLAITPERNHFSLFGIEKKALLRTDVTLDFQNYINQKLTEPGQYVVKIEVVDKMGQSTRATLSINVVKPKDATTPLESGQIQLQRQGKGIVAGGERLGITWKTIDKIKVTIQLSKLAGGASKLARFTNDDYEQLLTKEALNERVSSATDINEIEFDTSLNAATGKVVGIKNLGKFYLLRILKSNTRLSSIGTTVTLNGEYKF